MPSNRFMQGWRFINYGPMKKLNYLIVAALLVAPLSIFGGEFWSDMQPAIATASTSILIRHGLCTDKQRDCVTKEFVFVGGTFSGTDVQFYGVDDAATITELIGVCAEQYVKNQRKISITVRFYRETHREMMGTVRQFLTSPAVQVDFKREE